MTPAPDGHSPDLLAPERCVMREAAQLDLVGPQFLIWCGETWGRQIVAAWAVLRGLIALRLMVDELSDEEVRALVDREGPGLLSTARRVGAAYREWHATHAGTIDVHDPMFDANHAGLFAWVDGFAPDNATWTIKDAVKDEMYLELAATVQALRGQAPTVGLPALAYWRCTPFAPASIRPGAEGMPPF